MNIPQDTLQAVADEAFNQPIQSRLSTRAYHSPEWGEQERSRRAVIQHALSNPALAPFMSGGIGGYTDEEIKTAFGKVPMIAQADTLDLLRAFLAALPRRESPALAQAVARAEKAEADAAFNYGKLLAAREHTKSAQAELSSLKSSQLGILRPLSEMPEKVPDGCSMITEWQPIETAPTEGSVDIFIASIHNGKVHQIDFYAIQEWESESWEMPQQYLIWKSEFGNVEEPTHWAPMPRIPAAKKGGAK